MSKHKNTSNSLKLQIVKAYLQQKKSVSELSSEHGVKPSQIYLWVSQLFENGERCFERKNDRMSGEGAAKRYNSTISDLESKLANKNAVIGELLEELLVAKKQFGALGLKSGSANLLVTK
jgi:transposase-like protein